MSFIHGHYDLTTHEELARGIVRYMYLDEWGNTSYVEYHDISVDGIEYFSITRNPMTKRRECTCYDGWTFDDPDDEWKRCYICSGYGITGNPSPAPIEHAHGRPFKGKPVTWGKSKRHDPIQWGKVADRLLNERKDLWKKLADAE